MKSAADTVRVLAMPRYEPAGASSRVRMYQFEPYLRANGFSLQWQPLLSAAYIDALYKTGQRPRGEVLRGYVRRALALREAGSFDVIWLEKELWPWLPAALDPGVLKSQRYVVDYDDATFHSYDQHWFAPARAAFGKKIDAVMRAAATVVAGNAYLAAHAREAGAKDIVIVPSVVDANIYAPRHHNQSSSITFGWIGSPGSQKLLEPLFPIIASALTPGDRFVTVGARFSEGRFPGHVLGKWSVETEAATVASFDIGLMPVDDEPFERGKCGYKLIQYMACGVPVIASPVGANREIVIDGETGFLAATPAEWRTALTRLRNDAVLRQRMGEAGRRRFEQHYSVQVAAPKLAAVLRAAGGA